MSTPALEALTVAVAANVPVILWGSPGTGKTSVISTMAATAGWPLEVVIASIREPTDFSGLPVVSADGDVRFAPPSWARRLAAEERGVLFLDELSTAPPAVQAALLRVVLERAVGDLVLPAPIRVVAAANPPDQAADGWDLAAPLANRFCHIDWSVQARAWADGMVSGFPEASLVELDHDRLESQIARRAASVAGFVASRPALLSVIPDSSAAAGQAWPSPRSWSMVSRLLAASELLEVSPEAIAVLVSGSVGPVAGLEFLAWRDGVLLPDPEVVLADPGSFELPSRGDQAYAALAALVAAVAAEPTSERWRAAWSAVGHSTRDQHQDLAVVAVRSLLRCRPDGAAPDADTLRDMAPVLREAGMFDSLTGRA